MATYRETCTTLLDLLRGNADELQIPRDNITIGHNGSMPQVAPFILCIPTTEQRTNGEQGVGTSMLAFDVFVGCTGNGSASDDMYACVELAGAVAAMVTVALDGRYVLRQAPSFDTVYSGYACAYFTFATPVSWIT